VKFVIWILNCYPRRWREHYQEEMLALLEEHTITLRTGLDLLFGAIDVRLNPTYTVKEGFMFQRIRDVRSLSLLYLCVLAAFLFLISFWLVLGSSLSFQDNVVGATTNMLGAICISAVSLVSLIALLGIAGSSLLQSVKNRRWRSLLFALICLGLALGVFPRSISFPPPLGFPLFVYIPDLLLVFETALLLGVSLFVTGVKGLGLLKSKQRRLIFLALLIDFLLPAFQYIYVLWGEHTPHPGETFVLAPGYFLVGNIAFSSLFNFLQFLLNGFIPFFALGALLLTLASNPFSMREWRITRIFGVIMTLLLICDLSIVLIWDINRWIGGGVWIFEPTAGVWPLFGGHWVGPLITNALILALTVVIILVVMIRSFILQPDGEHPTRAYKETQS